MSDAASSVTPDDIERGRAALLEITPASTIGESIGSVDEGDGVTSVHYGVEMPGYPGWRWTATIAHVDGMEPTVLETEMTPGDGALLAPDWVPWVDRLADYQAAQDAAVLAADESEDDESGDDEFDDDDLDEDDESIADEQADDLDDDSEQKMRSRLHAGDLDGVDIDSLDETSDDDADSVESDDTDSDLDDFESDDDEDSTDPADGTPIGSGDGSVTTADAAPSATAEDVDQPESAQDDAESAGDEPVDAEPADRRTEQH